MTFLTRFCPQTSNLRSQTLTVQFGTILITKLLFEIILNFTYLNSNYLSTFTLNLIKIG